MDSQVLIWHKMDRASLSSTAISLLENVDSDLSVSLVSFWELTIKESLGKLEVPGQILGLYSDWHSMTIKDPLKLKWKHVLRLGKLPPIHRDPFDRMLIAQALEEDLTILTCDDNIRSYPQVKTLW
ncbi:MAG: type II toxin-antitoxin system VapC family toxin [Blastochloris sp.]|nr:type II toxin-antitoxin system VapC family toxin [Blastochloris sp.]